MQTAKQEEKRSSANGGRNKPASSSSDNVRVLPADEWFANFKEEVLDQPGTRKFRGWPHEKHHQDNCRDSDPPVWCSEIAAWQEPCLASELVLIDEKRSVQEKLHGIGAKVLPNDQYVAERSSRLFRDTAPYLLRDTDCWVFSRSLVFKDYAGLIDEAMKFHSHDPVGGLLKRPGDMPLGTRCTEVFIFVAGDFAVEDGELKSREAVLKLLDELTTAEGMRKIRVNK
ncbi:hypothetical protein OROHE_001344 [Orobanche hederae]